MPALAALIVLCAAHTRGVGAMPAPGIPQPNTGGGDKEAPRPPAETEKYDEEGNPVPPGPAEPDTPPGSPPENQEVVVYLKDGQRLTGILLEASGEVLRVRIAGIPTPLLMETVEKYEVLPPISKRYIELRQAVGNNPGQILQLAQWLREREKYELALGEVERALAIDAAVQGGRELKRQLEQQIILRDKSAKPAGEDPSGGGADAGAAPKAGKVRRPEPFPLLSRDQINLIKVYELDMATKPRVLIPRDTITRLLEQNSGHPLVPVTREGREAWYRKPPLEILELMFRLQARNLYPQVQVLDQPRAFEVFRDDLQRNWLLNTCATNQCHGGSEAGRLMLYNRQPNSEATVYTNFLILDRYRLADGTPLINVEEPEKSPLLQLGLHPEDSRYPHPEVRNERNRNLIRPVFQWTDDPDFVRGVEWIRMLFRPRAEYPIEYKAPEGKTPGDRKVVPVDPEDAAPRDDGEANARPDRNSEGERGESVR